MTRRSALRGSALATLIAALVPRATHAQGEPVRVVHVGAWLNAGYGSSTIAYRRAVYDRMTVLTSLEGLVNRTAPRLYSITWPAIDELWLSRIQGAQDGGDVFAGRSLVRLNPGMDAGANADAILADVDTGLDAALVAYRSSVRGLAVWDERVPATLNGAYAAAGVEDLLVVRYDADPHSEYQRLLGMGFTAVVKLVNDDGSSLFVNAPPGGQVPGLDAATAHPSSGRAKDDVYLWALQRYLRTGRSNPTEFGLMIDGQWVTNPAYDHSPSPLGIWYVPNHDYLVSHRGIPFDLSFWDDLPASDDPGAPAGLDARVEREILGAARALAGHEVISIRGFIPWPFKYSVPDATDFHRNAEWYSVALVSPFAAGLDADAYSPSPAFANASFFEHVPLDPGPEPQRRPTAEDLVGEGLLHGLADNGGFEDEAHGWTLDLANARVYQDATHAHSGLHFLEANAAAGDATHLSVHRDGPAVEAGTTVTMRAFVRAHSPMRIWQTVWALGGTQEHTTTDTMIGTDWTEVRTTLQVAHGGHTSTRAQIYLQTPGVNLDVDDVAFYAGDAASGHVVPANYVLWLLGDHDSAAWLYNVTPGTWDGDGRGRVPVAWDFSGHPAPRFPPHFRHVLATRTPRDFFIGADSGPGYAMPSAMGAPAQAIWAAAGVRDARWLDTSAGWVLDPIRHLDAATIRSAVLPYYGDGVLVGPYLTAGSDTGLIGNTPVLSLRVPATSPHPESPPFGYGSVTDLTYGVQTVSPAPTTPVFSAYRVVQLHDLAKLVADTSDRLAANYADRQFRFVDPYTFFYLARTQMGGSNTHRASYRAVQVPDAMTVGQPATVHFTVRNDGWETWRAAGTHRYRAGVSMVDGDPATSPAPAYDTRLALPHDVPPGGEVALSVDVPAFAHAGTRTLQVDMVEEDVTWFEATHDVPLVRALHGVDAMPPDRDAAVATDASSRPDATPEADGAVGAEARDAVDHGCGCGVVALPRTGGRAVLAAVALGLLAVRRRRRVMH